MLCNSVCKDSVAKRVVRLCNDGDDDADGTDTRVSSSGTRMTLQSDSKLVMRAIKAELSALDVDAGNMVVILQTNKAKLVKKLK